MREPTLFDILEEGWGERICDVVFNWKAGATVNAKSIPSFHLSCMKGLIDGSSMTENLLPDEVNTRRRPRYAQALDQTLPLRI